MTIITIGLFLHAVLAGWAAAAKKEIPEPLRGWEGWVTWGEKHLNCPTPYHAANEHICFWPSTLSIRAGRNAGGFDLDVTVFEETWVPLPGGSGTWPFDVRTGETKAVVLERSGHPNVRLAPGTHRLTGSFQWDQMPQWIAIPQEVGLLSLVVESKPVDLPNWDAAGRLWLRRIRSDVTDENQLAVKVYRLLEDGIPMWLRTELELSVSGASREERLGWVLPAGWKLATVDSPVPVAIDDQGRMKAQVRAGKWRIRLDAFRTSDAREIAFSTSAEPVVSQELLAFKPDPELRTVELEGLTPVDVAQTTLPQAWRNYSVFQWATDSSCRIVETVRGMGLQRPRGLKINRQFWLDENGRGLTFRDHVEGQMQQLWRLDVSGGQELGAVRIDGQGQLITTHPETGAHGVEIRTRQLNMDAIGRIASVTEVPAAGWRTDADSLGITLNLPPGWRLLALFGADWVYGDWVTAWSLLDLFLLLIFSLSVFRLWGWWAGLVALIAFGLAYHEPVAPRYAWFFLLIPLALLRVVPKGAAHKWMAAWKLVAVIVLTLCLVPFVAMQIQSALYPQLERQGVAYPSQGLFRFARTPSLAKRLLPAARSSAVKQKHVSSRFPDSNLWLDPNTRIQTGPAEPEWKWNQVYCGWDGPVSAGQRMRLILISLPMQRVLSVLRPLLLLALAGILLGVRGLANPFSRRAAQAALTLCLACSLPAAAGAAEIPDQTMLNTLRERLLEPADAYPHGATIPNATVRVADGKITMDLEVHCAVGVAVPLPGQLPSWSPLTVKVDDDTPGPLCRKDGYLWVLLSPGVHHLVVKGLLPNATEWQWTFLLKPKRVSITAPEWTVTGLRPNGIPEDQIFLVRHQEISTDKAEYEQKDFNAIVAVDRRLEVGLIWQARTEVTRLSSSSKAVSLNVPLLAGEKVLTSNVVVKDGHVEVRLGAGEKAFAWESELPITPEIRLEAQDTDRWIERWHLLTSPAWNVAMTNLTPVFEPEEQNLIPVWHPWPGQGVTLSFSKPEAVSGQTVTVRRVRHEVSLGKRQRTVQLTLDIESSLGDDFGITLDPQAEVSLLQLDGRRIPVRREGGKLMIAVHPGEQKLEIGWATPKAMATAVRAAPVVLPVDGANITTIMRIPESRWVLWAHGPLRGPAVRFWTILGCAILAAWVLASLRLSPISRTSWMLLAIGLTQVHLALALTVVGWFFLLAWRGKPGLGGLAPWRFNLLQLALILLSAAAAAVLVVAVSEGLLGNPEMFIRGNGSSPTFLQWSEPRAGLELPQPLVVSCSVWIYRYLMLAWALWLAVSLIRWLKWGWGQFSSEGCWKPLARTAKPAPPLLPGTNANK